MIYRYSILAFFALVLFCLSYFGLIDFWASFTLACVLMFAVLLGVIEWIETYVMYKNGEKIARKYRNGEK